MDKVEEFKNEVIALCKKYKLSISHEDGHGAFEIEPYDKLYTEWFLEAFDNTKPKDKDQLELDLD